MPQGEIKIVGYEAKYRDWTDSEKKPFGAHKYVTLNGDRKGIELKGVMVSYRMFYECDGKKFSVNYEV